MRLLLADLEQVPPCRSQLLADADELERLAAHLARDIAYASQLAAGEPAVASVDLAGHLEASEQLAGALRFATFPQFPTLRGEVGLVGALRVLAERLSRFENAMRRATEEGAAPSLLSRAAGWGARHLLAPTGRLLRRGLENGERNAHGVVDGVRKAGEQTLWNAAEIAELLGIPAFDVDAHLVKRVRSETPLATIPAQTGVLDSPDEEILIETHTYSDGTRDYTVVLRGLNLASWGVNDFGSTVDEVLSGDGAYARAAIEAMEREIPAGATVHLVGHSMGGATAMNIANNARVASTYNVTHVLTAASPVDYKPTPAGVKVLQVENTRDLIPYSDVRPNPEVVRPDILPRIERPTMASQRGPEQVYQFAGPLAGHDFQEVYQPVLESERFQNSAEYRAFRQGWREDAVRTEVATYRLTETVRGTPLTR